MKRHLPNTLTLMNLVSGCIGLSLAAGDHLVAASCFILIAAVFDLLDGMVARWLGVTSALGKELDSLSDMVSFGVLPAMILHAMLGGAGWLSWLPLIIIPSLAALRLARFNIITGDTSSFQGLPSPAAALLLGTWPLAIYCGKEPLTGLIQGLLEYPVMAAIVASFLGLLMVTPVKMLAFKVDNKHSWREDPNRVPKTIIILGSLILLAGFYCAALPFMVLLYTMLSLYVQFTSKPV